MCLFFSCCSSQASSGGRAVHNRCALAIFYLFAVAAAAAALPWSHNNMSAMISSAHFSLYPPLLAIKQADEHC